MAPNKFTRNFWQTVKGLMCLLLSHYISKNKDFIKILPKGAKVKNRLIVLSLFLGAFIFKLMTRLFDKFIGYWLGMRKLTSLAQMFLTDPKYGIVSITLRFEKFDFQEMSEYIK